MSLTREAHEKLKWAHLLYRGNIEWSLSITMLKAANASLLNWKIEEYNLFYTSNIKLVISRVQKENTNVNTFPIQMSCFCGTQTTPHLFHYGVFQYVWAVVGSAWASFLEEMCPLYRGTAENQSSH